MKVILTPNWNTFILILGIIDEVMKNIMSILLPLFMNLLKLKFWKIGIKDVNLILNYLRRGKKQLLKKKIWILSKSVFRYTKILIYVNSPKQLRRVRISTYHHRKVQKNCWTWFKKNRRYLVKILNFKTRIICYWCIISVINIEGRSRNGDEFCLSRFQTVATSMVSAQEQFA